MSEIKKGFNWTFGIFLAMIVLGVSGSIVGYTVLSADPPPVDTSYFCMPGNKSCVVPVDIPNLAWIHVNDSGKNTVVTIPGLRIEQQDEDTWAGTIYVAPEFVKEDEELKNRREAKSLKGYYIIRRLKDDGVHDFEYIDWNFTSVTFRVKVKDSGELNKDILIKVGGVVQETVKLTTLASKSEIIQVNHKGSNWSFGSSSTVDTQAVPQNATFADTSLDTGAASTHYNNNYGLEPIMGPISVATANHLDLALLDLDDVIGSGNTIDNLTFQPKLSQGLGSGNSDTTWYRVTEVWNEGTGSGQTAGNASAMSPRAGYENATNGATWLTQVGVNGQLSDDVKGAKLAEYNWEGGVCEPCVYLDIDLTLNSEGKTSVQAMYDGTGNISIGGNITGPYTVTQRLTLYKADSNGNEPRWHIEYSAGNTAPSFSSPVLTPEPSYHNDTLNMSVDITESDADTLEVWFTGFNVTGETDGPILNVSFGDGVECTNSSPTSWNGVTCEIKDSGLDVYDITTGNFTGKWYAFDGTATMIDITEDTFMTDSAPEWYTEGMNATIDEDTSKRVDDDLGGDGSPGNCTDIDSNETVSFFLDSSSGGTWNLSGSDLSFIPTGNSTTKGIALLDCTTLGGLTSDNITVGVDITGVNDAPWWNPLNNDTNINTASFYQPLNINASVNFRDVENLQSPNNITISDDSSTADCTMPSTNDGNFSIFCKNSVEETIDITLNGTDSGTPELSAIISFQVNSATQYTSAFAQNVSIADFDFASLVYETVENITFNTTKAETNFTVISSFNLGKVGGGSRTVSARVLVNGKEKEVEDLLTLSGTEELSTGIKPFTFELASGEHSLELQMKSSGSGIISVTDIDFILLEFISSQDNLIDDSIFNVTATVTSTSFSNIFEFVETDAITASHTYYSKFAITKDTATNEDIYLFLSNLNVTDDDSPVAARYLSGSGDMGSAAVGFYGQPVRSHTMALYGKLSAADTVFVNGSLLSFKDTDEGENVIQGFQATSNSSQFNNTQSLTAGNTTLISHEQFLENGTDMLLTAIVSMKSTSGSQTPIVWVNSSGCFSKKERTLKTNTDEANIKIFLECPTNGTYDLNIDVPTGETLDILDESFFGFEVSEFNVGEVSIAPLSNDFITANNSNVSITSNITWNLFEGATSYDLGLFNTDFSLNSLIVDDFADNSTNVTWTDFTDGDYYMIATGNNAVGSVNNTAIFITIDNTGPEIYLVTLNDTSFTGSGNVSLSYNATDTREVQNCTINIDEVVRLTDLSITKDVQQDFSISLPNADYNWSMNCTDVLNNVNNSNTLWFTRNYEQPLASGGSGGGRSGCQTTGFKCTTNDQCCSNFCKDLICVTEEEEAIEEGIIPLVEEELEEGFLSETFNFLKGIFGFGDIEQAPGLTIIGEEAEPTGFDFTTKNILVWAGIIIGSILILYFFGAAIASFIGVVALTIISNPFMLIGTLFLLILFFLWYFNIVP